MDRSARPNFPNGFGLLFIHLGALLCLVPAFFSWSALAAAAVLAFVTGAWGVTLNYHRTLTHRSLRMVKPLEYLTALFATLTFQGGPIQWVATHRVHHAHSDHEGDPHDITRGITWAHITWLFRTNPSVPRGDLLKKYAPDLYSQPYYRALQALHVPLQIALIVGLYFIGQAFGGVGWSWVVWAGFGRLVYTYHTTWLVNSAAHTVGYRSYSTRDKSTNSWWVALLTSGEGWHNNHHAFPFSARHGLRKREVDFTWMSIKFLAFLHLVDNVRVPTEAMRARLKLPEIPRVSRQS